jgi:serine/alanine adding enzyme
MVMQGLAEHAAVAAEIQITSAVSGDEWDRFVLANPDASGYHLWKWRQVFEGAFGHETLYLAARQGGQLVGILPLVLFASRLFGRFAVSLPFVNYGGVCAPDPDVAQLLADGARTILRERDLSHVELRHTARRYSDLAVRQHKVGMKLPLPGCSTDAWDALDRKVRNQVRKAEKSELAVRGGGGALIERFYPVFAQNMRDLGTPVYSIRLFEQVLAAFPDTARVFLVEKGHTVVGGAIALVHRRTLEVPWASSLREYRNLCPNNLLYWRIIEYAIDAGMSTLDFGRSTPNEGTFDFKKQWGAQPELLHWEYVLAPRATLPDMSPANPRFHTAIAAWQRLPLWFANTLGPHIVRSLP